MHKYIKSGVFTKEKDLFDNFILRSKIFNETLNDSIIKYYNDNNGKDILDLFNLNRDFWINLFNELLKEKILKYYNYNYSSIETALLIKYSTGFKFSDHFNPGILTVKIFLNFNLKGGEINFKNQNYKFKPSIDNNLLVFPSKITHNESIEEITEGNQYVLLFFLQ